MTDIALPEGSPSPLLVPVDFDPFAESPPVSPRALSEAQREIWAVVQMGPDGSCAYNQCLVLVLRGDISISALKSSVVFVVERHDALRTRFDATSNAQFVDSSSPWEVDITDLSFLSSEERSTAVEAIHADEFRKPFDLANGPIARARIVILAADHVQLVFSSHHIVYDGSSSRMFFRELAVCYNAQRAGEAPQLDPATPFSQHLDREASVDGQTEAGTALDFWCSQFTTIPPSLALPTDRPRPAVKTYRVGRVVHTMQSVTSHDVTRAAGRIGATSVGFLLAAFQVLLARLTGQNDQVVGLPISVREAHVSDTLMGHATNLLPMRAQLDAGMKFSELLLLTRKLLLDSQDHSSLTFGTLVHRLAMPTDLGRTPLVSTLFNVDRGRAAPTLDGCQTELMMPPRCFGNFELELQVIDLPPQLCLECTYNSDLFDASSVARWLGLYETLVHGAVTDIDTPIGRLPLLTQTELETLQRWNATHREYARDVAISRLVELQVLRTPQAVAVLCGATAIQYAELNRRANRLARELRERGAGPSHLVGLFVERSVEMVIGMLAVLKTGAAYVPLDPSFPKDRVAHMLEDSQLRLVVVHQRLRDSLPAFEGTLIDIDPDTPSPHSDENLDIAPAPNDPAYVIYTSGSTGKPKGVCVQHRAAVNFLTSMLTEPGLSSDDCILAVTTLSFDIAFLELMLPLVVGARVVITSRDQAMDGQALSRLISEHDCTLLQATPSTWRLLLQSGWGGKKGFRALCGGEPLPLDVAEALVEKVDALWNMYGPTETTVWSTCSRVLDPRVGVDIGRPIANTSVWILDAEQQLCPIGVTGEIYIGGDGVALGYLNRVELTSERFVADPSSSAPGARLYRTGDLGRWRADGRLECLGRNDFQVKIRGHRIELGEIEVALLKHPQVEHAVVHVKPSPSDPHRLVGYLVTTDHGTIVPAGVVDYLRSKLPAYMVPSAFVVLSRLPLTPSGKVDRGTLPDPTGSITTPNCRAACTPTEHRLVSIWQQLLGAERVGTNENFFDIGGHSLLAVALVSAVKEQLGVELSVATVLQDPTISALARAVDHILAPEIDHEEQSSPYLTQLRAGGAKSVFFVYDGEGEILPYHNLARRLPLEYSVFGVSPLRVPGIPLCHLSVRDMAEHCVRAIQQCQPHGPYYVGGLCAGGVIAFEVAQQLEQKQEPVELVILLDAVDPTTPTRPWLVTLRRWRHLTRLLFGLRRAHQERASSPALAARSLRSILGETALSARNVVQYETTRLAESVWVSVRLQLMKHVVDHGRTWPTRVPPLRVSDIYAYARARHQPGVVSARVALVRADDGEQANAPARAFVQDPLLGWAHRTTAELEIIDAPGGHVSMLQVPHVDEVAHALSRVLRES